jgi:hypothetical protein
MSLDPSPPDRRSLILAAMLIAAGALLRLTALNHPPPINIDEVRYLLTAHHVAAGMGYCDWRGPETHIHPAHPLLTAALAGSRQEDLESYGRAVTFLASVLILIPLAGLAFRLGGVPTALVGLAFIALHPDLTRAAGTIQPEGFYVLATSLAILLLLPGSEASLSLWRWGLAGASFGAAYLARPEGIPVGVLAGTMAAGLGLGKGRPRVWPGFSLMLMVLLATASPFLLFIHRTTGEWSLTGKTLELFFIGQGLRETGGNPPDFLRLRQLQQQWGGILPFLWANPRAAIESALLNARGIFGSVLPALLGPVGLLGLVGFLAALPGNRGMRRRSLLVLAPCLTLVLMLLTFPNSRVAGSVLPFLLILSALGWMTWFKQLVSSARFRAGLAIALLSLGGLFAWSQTIRRLREGPARDGISPERSTSLRALEEAGDPGRIASNDPVESFYAGDPALFGPPGIYRPLPVGLPCSELETVLRERHARVAILSGSKAAIFVDTPSPDCSLHLVFETQRRDGEPLRVLALEEDAESALP